VNDKLRALLIRHEGIRLMPYEDSVGKLTIGIGRCLDDNGISMAEAEFMLANDVDWAIAEVRNVFSSEWPTWNEVRQNAMVDFMLNLGPVRFGQFKKMISAIRANDWPRAAWEMRHSLWSSQVSQRAEDLASMIESGEDD